MAVIDYPGGNIRLLPCFASPPDVSNVTKTRVKKGSLETAKMAPFIEAALSSIRGLSKHVDSGFSASACRHKPFSYDFTDSQSFSKLVPLPLLGSWEP